MWQLEYQNGISEKFFRINPMVIGKMREEFSVSECDEERLVEELQIWVKNDTDLPVEAQDKQFLLILLQRAKYNLDKAKVRLVNYFKTIPVYQEYWDKMGVYKLSDPENFSTVISFPKLTPKNERITFLRMNPGGSSKFDFFRGMVMTVSAACVCFHRDQAPKFRFLIDCSNFSIFNFLKISPYRAYQIMQINEKLFSIRITGIDVINAPYFTKQILAVFRPVMKKKLYERICIHSDLESLHRKIPPECLPKEYQGDLGRLEDLTAQFGWVMEDEQELYKKFQSFGRDKL